MAGAEFYFQPRSVNWAILNIAGYIFPSSLTLRCMIWKWREFVASCLHLCITKILVIFIWIKWYITRWQFFEPRYLKKRILRAMRDLLVILLTNIELTIVDNCILQIKWSIILKSWLTRDTMNKLFYISKIKNFKKWDIQKDLKNITYQNEKMVQLIKMVAVRNYCMKHNTTEKNSNNLYYKMSPYLSLSLLLSWSSLKLGRWRCSCCFSIIQYCSNIEDCWIQDTPQSEFKCSL